MTVTSAPLLSRDWEAIPNEVQIAVGQLPSNGHCIMPFDVDGKVKPVIDGWLRFLQQPQEVRNLFCLDPEKADPDEGYISRQGQARHTTTGKYDYKEYFHFRGDYIEKLVQANAPHKDWSNWLNDFSALYDECLLAAKQVADVLEKVVPGYNIGTLVRDKISSRKHVVRLLHYKQSKAVGELIGKNHTDRNFFTLHLDESHPGLLCDLPTTTYEYAKKAGQVLVFPGQKMEMLTSGTLRALPHGVVAKEESFGVNRWSAVFFCHIPLIVPGETV